MQASRHAGGQARRHTQAQQAGRQTPQQQPGRQHSSSQAGRQHSSSQAGRQHSSSQGKQAGSTTAEACRQQSRQAVRCGGHANRQAVGHTGKLAAAFMRTHACSNAICKTIFCCHLRCARVHTRVFALIRLCGGGGRSPAAGRSSYTFCMTSWNQDSPCCTKVSSGTRTRKRRRILPKALRMLALSKIAGPMQPHAGLAPSKSQALCNMLALCSNILALCR